MREIKFRFWETNLKYMLETRVFDEDDVPVDLNNFFKRILRDHLIVMQYTGLKDKLGKEIYEGDIEGLDGKPFYQVVWNDKEAMFNFTDLSGVIVNDFDFSSYEVIGNRYENPEMIEKAHEGNR